MNKGGYEIGYKNSDSLWGKKPGSLIIQLEDYIDSFEEKMILDLGSGEGKNAFYLGEKGAFVDAYELSADAIRNGKSLFSQNRNVKINHQNVLDIDISLDQYDIIISYGLFHCFKHYEDVEILIEKSLLGLKKDGFFIVCAFNSRCQDLSAHEGFSPLLLDHQTYLNFFLKERILFASDEDLYETHPHNNIPHSHSMTRMIIKKS